MLPSQLGPADPADYRVWEMEQRSHWPEALRYAKIPTLEDKVAERVAVPKDEVTKRPKTLVDAIIDRLKG